VPNGIDDDEPDFRQPVGRAVIALAPPVALDAGDG